MFRRASGEQARRDREDDGSQPRGGTLHLDRPPHGLNTLGITAGLPGAEQNRSHAGRGGASPGL